MSVIVGSAEWWQVVLVAGGTSLVISLLMIPWRRR
jgi:hypothetical protein